MATKQTLDINETLNKSEAFFVKYKTYILGAIAAIILIIAGVSIWKNQATKKEEKASTMLAKGQNYFAGNDYESALNGDKAGYIGFLQIAKKYSSTKAGNLANLYAGLCYYYKDDAKNAVKYLEAFDTKSDFTVSPAATAALADCYASTGNVDKAISLLKKAAEKSNTSGLSPIFLKKAGILLESQNKLDEAKKLYEEIQPKYRRSAEGQDIEKYIERVSK